MMIDKKNIEDAINKEIEWCNKQNSKQAMVDPKFHKGFIAGLKQALFLLKKIRSKIHKVAVKEEKTLLLKRGADGRIGG